MAHLLDHMNPAVAGLAGSKIREVANEGMLRPDTLAFWFGEPYEVTPEAIRSAAMASLSKGETFYSSNLGIPDLRLALARYLTTRHASLGATPGTDQALADRIAITSAGVNALMLAAQSLLTPGDRVLAIVPLWPNLVEAAKLLGAQVERFPLQVNPLSNRWQLDIDKLLQALATRPKALVLNSPNNPTGWTASAQEMAAIVAACREYGVWLLSDEAYDRLHYGAGETFGRAPSALDYCLPDDPVIIANTFSKTWQMTGWRLGWLVLPEGLSEPVGKLIEFNTSCAPVFVQRAGMAALATGEAPIMSFVNTLAERRSFLIEALRSMPGVRLPEADGAMYAFFSIAGQTDSLRLAKSLVADHGLGLAPGIAFGPEAEGWLRWCYAKPIEMLEAGLQRLRAALQ